MDYGVITICLNAAETLPRTADSVLSQTRLPTRYVIVDGGSTDGTLEVIREVERRGAAAGVAVACVNQPKPEPGVAGIPAAWNLGLRELRTDLVFILNADDWYEPRAAACVMRAYAEAPDAFLVAGPVRFRTPGKDSPSRVRQPRSTRWLPVLMPILHPAFFVRREAYDRVGPFDTRYRISADYDFVYRCVVAGLPIARLSETVVNMQVGGLANTNRSAARGETLEIALRHGRARFLPWLAYILRCVLGR